MAMAQSPTVAARSRYAQSFTSTIFDPAQNTSSQQFVPAGKRRDQTTSEMFGNYDEKDLRGCPKTFAPKDDVSTARQRKFQFLSSDVLPHSQHPPSMAPERSAAPHRPEMDEDADSTIDTNLRKQVELSSKLFGRETPLSTAEQVHDRGNKLPPSDYKWHNHPQPLHSSADESMSHTARAYQQKCSSVFAHRSPEAPGHGSHTMDAERAAKEQESLAEQKRRANVYYSDLFGRSTPMEAPDQHREGYFRPKIQGSHEDQIVVHSDWTDSKTELMNGARTNRPEHPLLRKSDELHQTRIFGHSSGWQASTDRPEAQAYDNSVKVKGAIGQSTQQMHQAHLRTSMTPSEFYEEAETTKHWEVVELHISGLAADADDGRVQKLCKGCDLHIVKVATEMDPVSNLCKGRAKILVRYNPLRDSVAGLVQKLEESRLKVEL